jgi:hypothetical protein
LDFKAINQSFKGFDWRSLKKYASPKAADDLNLFIEKLPQNTGQAMLVVAVGAWVTAAAVGLFTTVQLQTLTEIRAEFQDAQALQPTVPKIKDVAVARGEVEPFVKQLKEVYTGLEISSSGANITITGNSTRDFGQFREAVGHVQNGGSGWRVNVEKFCVGRECDRYELYALLKINKVSVN